VIVKKGKYVVGIGKEQLKPAVSCFSRSNLKVLRKTVKPSEYLVVKGFS
jgi:hypothetical protein